MQVKFHLGQSEDCSQGESTSDSSEKLLQTSVCVFVCVWGVVVRIYMILVEGEFMQSSIYLDKRFAASHEELMSPQRDLVSAFLDMGRWKDWAYKTGSWKYLSEDLFH